MFPKVTLLLLFVGLIGFGYSAYNKYLILKGGKKIPFRLDLAKQFRNLFVFGFGQKKFFKHGILSGIMHAFIFWGFCAISLGTIILFGQGIDSGFASNFLNSHSGHYYNLFKNFFEVLVLVGATSLLFRRLIIRPKRLTLNLEGNLILILIICLMITDFMIEGRVAPDAAYFIHTIFILLFLNWLPYSKHFHIITALPNVFLKNIGPSGKIPLLDLENQEAETFGVGKINEFSWKQYLDLYSCTECGRCEEQCPAYATEKPLSPKKFSIDLKNHLNKSRRLKELPELAENVIEKDTVWACTTCKACEEACPVAIEYVDKMVDIRRNLVLMKGDLPLPIQNTLKNIETNFNPWGISYEKRADWAKGLGIKLFSEKPDAEYLLFVGCSAAFDERAKKAAVSLVNLLNKASVSFAFLGNEEKCTGDFARRVGNEYLFQTLAKENIAAFNKYKIKKIITACPHCYNTLKNEYPDFGGKYEVYHHTEILFKLIKDGKLSLKKVEGKVSYHDSCYLGRYNGIYDQPREILKKIGLEIREPKLNKDFGRCCGAGGGNMFAEEKPPRINQKRLEDFESTGAETVATACPFCLTMLSDAAKESNKTAKEIKDLSEILDCN